MYNLASNDPGLKGMFEDLDLKSDLQIVLSARKGIKPKVFYVFAKSIKISEKRLAEMINLSARTISNYENRRKLLEPVYGEHLLKLISLFGEGEKIFGNIDEFNYWLGKPFWNSEEKPIDWLATPGGVDVIKEELDRLGHGYPV